MMDEDTAAAGKDQGAYRTINLEEAEGEKTEESIDEALFGDLEADTAF